MNSSELGIKQNGMFSGQRCFPHDISNIQQMYIIQSYPECVPAQSSELNVLGIGPRFSAILEGEGFSINNDHHQHQ